MKKQLIEIGMIVAIGVLGALPASAQLIVKDQDLSMEQNSLIYVNGDVVTEDGEILNNGSLVFDGNWENLNSTTADLEANGFVSGSSGEVVMSGGVQQIKGRSTRFPTLSLGGTGKKILMVDKDKFVEISSIGKLLLNSAELDVNGKVIAVLNDDKDAISWIGGTKGSKAVAGFVNTSALPRDNGSLVRKVKKGVEYAYPVGSRTTVSPTAVIRPVMLKAIDNATDVAVQFLNYDPNNDEYNRDKTQAGLTGINPNFFHTAMIKGQVSSVEFKVLYNNVVDGKDYTGLAYYQSAVALPEQKWTIPTEKGEGREDGLGFGTNRFASQYDSSPMIPESIYPLALANISAKADEHEDLFIPNAFTPNNDGTNDTFRIMNTSRTKNLLELYPSNDLVIMNRWGQSVYERKNYGDDANNWRAEGLLDGTYFYMLKIHKTATNESFQKTGYITVLSKER